MPDTLLRMTTSLCGYCKRSLPGEIWQSDDVVVMRKYCPEHGASQVLVSSNVDWYNRVMTEQPLLTLPNSVKPVSQGCPFDCGPCTQHEQNVQLPIVPITSACNLDCPICYTHNKNKGAWHMSEEQLLAILQHLRKVEPGKRIINITGGEPTQHPLFERLIELCHREGIHRITVSTHGMYFLKDEVVLQRLKALDARIILSFDSFKPRVNQEMLGGNFLAAKMKVLALLEKYEVNTTLLPVLARGVNDDEMAQFIDLALSKSFIRSIELHTMTFTGQGGARFNRQGRYTTYDVLKDIECATQGMIRVSDFVPSPAAHPLCYLMTYLLKLDDGRWLPFTRFMEWADLRTLLGGALYMEPTAEMEQHLADVINRLWVGELECEDADSVLRALKRLMRELFSPDISELERLRIAEQSTKAIYVHAHMDEETFDTERIRQCPVGIREPDGTNIPSCAYNVLYRERDTRFMEAPQVPITFLGKGAFNVVSDVQMMERK